MAKIVPAINLNTIGITTENYVNIASINMVAIVVPKRGIGCIMTEKITTLGIVNCL